MCTLYKPPILACCSNLPCFTANHERRRAAGQLAAQENARYKDSYLRAFDPARPLHLESWVQRDMQKGFTDELQRLRPGRCQFCGERWFAAQTPTQAAAVAEGQYTCDRCKRDKKPVKSFSSANDMDPESVWVHGEKAPALPELVGLRLEGYTGPVWSSYPRYEGCVLIAPFETPLSPTGDDRGHETRQQVPLALCWSITMHKSQGQAMDKAVVDLRKSESTAGLTFVCLSRAKRLVDLLIEPMLLERLSKISDTPTFQLRLREEVRLRALAGETLHLHGGVE